MTIRKFNNLCELCQIIRRECFNFDCTICRLSNGQVNQIHGEINIPSRIRVGKVYIMGNDNKLYHYFYKEEAKDAPMPKEFMTLILRYNKNINEKLKTGIFEVQEGEIELLKLYNEDGEIVE